MKIVICVFLCASLAAARTIENNTSLLESKIIRGSFPFPLSLPYMTSIRWNYKHICAGTLISDLHVLSSASCVVLYKNDGPEYEGLLVAVGSYRLERIFSLGGNFYHIAHIEVNENFELDKICYSPSDISLITLYRRLKFSFHLRSIDLSEIDFSKGGTAQIVGWGIRESYDPKETLPEFSNFLRYADAEIIPVDQCREFYETREITVYDNQTCTIPISNIGHPALGDGGSPLVMNNRLVGILSYYLGGKENEDTPSIYTNVYHFEAYIKKAKKRGNTIFKRRIRERIEQVLLSSPIDEKNLSLL